MDQDEFFERMLSGMNEQTEALYSIRNEMLRAFSRIDTTLTDISITLGRIETILEQSEEEVDNG